MNLHSLLQTRELGDSDINFLHNTLEYRRISRLEVAKKCLPHSSSVSICCMQLDPLDYQYLITAGSDRKVSIYDTRSASQFRSQQLPCIATVDGQFKRQHNKAINCVQWYPHDTGMFVTSSFDGTIKVWDTNRMKPADTMAIRQPICNHHMSTISTNHLLIAAASSVHVRLADMRTGSTAHTLKGHRSNVLCVRWSSKDEYLLASGSEDNRVHLWDVRQAKAILRNLDQHNGGEGQQRTGCTAHDGSVNSLLFNHDGRFLLSFGTDERMRLWDIDSGRNTLVNYGRIENDSRHLPVYPAIHHGGLTTTVLFVPADRHVLMCDLYSGAFIRRLNEHFSLVRCCEYNPYSQELFTAAQSSNVLLWSPDKHVVENDNSKVHSRVKVASLLQDTWSDSD